MQVRLEDGIYRYGVFIDGITVYSAVNYDAREFRDVKIFIGDPWHQPANAFLKNFAFIQDDEMLCKLFFQNFVLVH